MLNLAMQRQSYSAHHTAMARQGKAQIRETINYYMQNAQAMRTPASFALAAT